MSTSDEMHERVGAYLIGAMSEEEFEAFETHLQSCDSCAAEIAENERAIVALALSVDRAPVEQAAEERGSLDWRLPALVAAGGALAGLLAVFAVLFLLDSELTDEIADAADVTEVVLQSGDGDEVRLSVSEDAMGVAFIGEQLPELAASERFALWQLAPDGTPTFLGFVREPDDSTQAWTTTPDDALGFALSIETVTEPPATPAVVALVGLVDES